MFLRPFRDFSGRAEHALHERAVALEMEMFDAALAGMGGQANRQDEIDEVHLQHLCFERLERSIGHLKPFGSGRIANPSDSHGAGGKPYGERLRAHLFLVNKPDRRVGEMTRAPRIARTIIDLNLCTVDFH